MLWFIQNIIFSVSLIVIIHYLYVYFETTLTAPKVKDLIHCPKQKYKSLFDTIHNNLDNSGARNLGIRDNEFGDGSMDGLSEKQLLPSSARGGGGSGGGIGGSGGGGGIGGGSSANSDMKNDLKTFLRGIGLKTQSSNANFRASYEMS